MPAAEEGCCTAVVREEPTRKPRVESTSRRAVDAKRRRERETQSRMRRHRVQNHHYPDTDV